MTEVLKSIGWWALRACALFGGNDIGPRPKYSPDGQLVIRSVPAGHLVFWN